MISEKEADKQSSKSNPQTPIMHAGFFFFPTLVPAHKNLDVKSLQPIQVSESVMDAVLRAMNPYKTKKNGEQRFLEISVEGDVLDFHLTFRVEGAMMQPDVHFAIRNDSIGHNAVLYWWYRLVQHPGTNALYWQWTGCAGAGDSAMMSRNIKPGTHYGSTAADILGRLLVAFGSNSTQSEKNHKSKLLTLS